MTREVRRLETLVAMSTATMPKADLNSWNLRIVRWQGLFRYPKNITAKLHPWYVTCFHGWQETKRLRDHFELLVAVGLVLLGLTQEKTWGKTWKWKNKSLIRSWTWPPILWNNACEAIRAEKPVETQKGASSWVLLPQIERHLVCAFLWMARLGICAPVHWAFFFATPWKCCTIFSSSPLSLASPLAFCIEPTFGTSKNRLFTWWFVYIPKLKSTKFQPKMAEFCVSNRRCLVPTGMVYKRQPPVWSWWPTFSPVVGILALLVMGVWKPSRKCRPLATYFWLFGIQSEKKTKNIHENPNLEAGDEAITWRFSGTGESWEHRWKTWKQVETIGSWRQTHLWNWPFGEEPAKTGYLSITVFFLIFQMVMFHCYVERRHANHVSTVFPFAPPGATWSLAIHPHIAKCRAVSGHFHKRYIINPGSGFGMLFRCSSYLSFNCPWRDVLSKVVRFSSRVSSMVAQVQINPDRKEMFVGTGTSCKIIH